MTNIIEKRTISKFENLSLPRLVLASASPRRAEILRAVGWEFQKITADIDETIMESETPESYVERLARTKAKAVAGKIKQGLVLGADTTVVIDNEIIGKPVDFNDAREMLKKLSGRWHKVLTGVALFKKDADGLTYRDGYEETGVKFATLSNSEIEFLVQHGEPLDKAGAYAVQAQAALFIEQITGDYWNVVGLPVGLVYRLSKEFSNFP